MLHLLWQIQWRRIWRFFKTRTLAKVITLGLFILVFTAVAVGLYKFFASGLQYLYNFPFFTQSLTLYSFELFFLLLSFLVWFGSSVTFLFGIFRNKGQELIMTSPSFSYNVPLNILSALFSLMWMYLFVLIPAVCALAKVFSLSFFSCLAIVTAGMLLLFCGVLFGYAVIIVIAAALRVVGSLTFVKLGGLLALLLVLAFAGMGKMFSRNNVVSILSAENLDLEQAPLGPVIQMFSWLPSNLAAQTVSNVLQGGAPAAGMVLGGLVVLAIVLSAAVYVMSRQILSVWQGLSENSARSLHKAGQFYLPFFSRLLKNKHGAVLYKETIVLLRSGKNALWILFLTLLWLSYIGFTAVLQKRLALELYEFPMLPHMLSAFQLGVLVFFMSAFVLRFVFPTLSAERNTVWIFASSPLALSKLIWAKFYFYLGLFGGLAFLIELINVYFLHLPLANSGVFLSLAGAAVVVIVSIGLFFGARYPNFETDDPQSLSTSIPGLLVVFSSVVYGTVAAAVYYSALALSVSLFPLLFAAVSVLASIMLVRAAASSSRTIDFVPGKHDE